MSMSMAMESIIRDRTRLGNHPYVNCKTRIISLMDIEIPEKASDDEYRQIYKRYVAESPSNSNAQLLLDAVDSIKYGICPPVAFPTETVYGLGADATNEPSVAGIFAAKGRPSDNPLIVHVSSVQHLERVTGSALPGIYKSLADKFFPGPLTILLPVPTPSHFARNVHPGQETIGFRIPSSKYARFFIAVCDRPIAGPSANSSGKPSPTTAQHVFDDLQGKINFILDAGPCDVGVESTVVDGLHDPPLILRPGGVSQAELIAHGNQYDNRFAHTAIGYQRHDNQLNSIPSSPSVPSNISTPCSSSSTLALAGKYDHHANGAPRAPGMKYRHYAPKGRMTLFSQRAVENDRVQTKLDNLVEASPASNIRLGIISCHWPPFAGLQLPSPPSKSSHNDTDSDTVSQSPYSTITRTTHLNLPNKTNLTLYDVHLGPEISVLAQSLFGVLRLFDDLKCDYIFAETVRRSTPSEIESKTDINSVEVPKLIERDHVTKKRDLEDAVIDRIEKAAGERIDS
ncbi:hypothetical protein B0A52_02577 [Exophiala mesophila]|uniref:Threonylcarbamoyl-AMP synthase n=1 Tax=Exophiala mesophila TaxID=212818 RepID=A0A438ND22_EXOME|nr:hypothetical protein B0A52_02577 [Exophiala mesophila]